MNALEKMNAGIPVNRDDCGAECGHCDVCQSSDWPRT